MEKKNKYMMSTIEEYFDILEKQSSKNSQIIAKSLVKYLKNTKENSKYETIKDAQKV